MSHAANLRNRIRPAEQESPAKRRRIEAAPKVNGISAIINGTTPEKKFVAVETKDVKRRKDLPSATAVVPTVGQGDEEDTSMLDVPPIDQDGVEDEDEEDGSDDEDDDEEEDEDLADDLRPSTSSAVAERPEDDADESGEQSFGDLLRARAPEQITVEPTATTTALTTNTSNRTLAIPNATSLGTVLTQALRTNDVDLLESCLQVPNLDSIRATIERLHSSLATSLLHKLAERLHRRPGRAGSLMVWVQWTIVAHGGYLANQPAAVKQLHTLYNVVKQRAAGLQSLLSLKGKLDMLEAQMRLRQSMQDRRRPGAVANQDEPGVVYVEGEEDQPVADADEVDMDEIDQDEDGEDSELDELAQIAPALAKRGAKSKIAAEDIELESDDDDDEDQMPDTLPNGVDGTDEEGSDDEDEEDDLSDDEAEESEGESELDEDGIDYDDEDLIDDEASESEAEETRPQPKAVKPQQRSGSKSR